MMLIDCPNCGPRNETEFKFGGQAHVAYPDDPQALSDKEWAQYLFYRKNPRGINAERWVHAAGCRKWFNALRDTVTYEFKAIYGAGEARPELQNTEGGTR
ncbi:sarcosine oxidase subunit delta [Arthrobacter sp. MYb211]|uniref:sarcosine oxidase subunit delta n=1 Tax=Micrococcaceae TaxID=1268 RepID=UPI000CFD358C|nr:MULTISPECIES: sarcosine oxidase subunit delta [unclassified Arthrobacter]PQZ96809.1 sarcosine oxidase subunit delta [Arthrobacter sp. MYb224]PQZ98058.1 sarcosine oxidase subunit delta [Arthrobacter sp. MYb229]PRA10015.1 sarcosine oxidase subunit delta [Arthrobacter sp. MYb221]PRB46940.1 sarcosine oxidase subunit delta [Arthrobacter sp. MYb216]PRC05207.1 sarcosine oxidase subunit delta [Arthrobacter sp. MYb211]